MQGESVMSDTVPEFGVRVSGVTYRNRPGAYAVVLGSESRFAFIRVKPNGCSYPAALWNRASRYNGIPKVSGSVLVSSTDR